MPADLKQDFAAFYDATWGRTVACAYAITGELGAAEDVAQEAYASTWSNGMTAERRDWPARRTVTMTPATSTARPGWLLDELATAGRENLDGDHVARYDAKMDSGAPKEVELLQQLGLTERSVVIDMGAGTGQFTFAVAPVSGRVVAVDVSPVMLQRLRARVERAGLTNVAVVRAGFLTYDHVGEPADIVYSRYALHHLPDFWKAIALTRMREMLRPGGVLRLSDVVWHFAATDAAERIEAWCATAGTQVEGEWSRDELEEHVRDEHSTFTWLLEPMIERTGFTIEQADYSKDGVDAQYVLRRG